MNDHAGTVLVLSASDPAIACTLDPAAMPDRLGDWETALATVTGRSPVDGGIRLTFAPDTDIGRVARLAQAEWACCSFFSFAITVDGRGAALEVRAPAAAREVVSSLFGYSSEKRSSFQGSASLL